MKADQPTTTAKRETFIRRILSWEASGVVIAFIGLCLVLALASPNFLNIYNITVVVRQASFVGLVALGETLILLLGGIDLSLGSCASLSAIFGCLLLTSKIVHPWLAIPVTALFGLGLGLGNGLFIALLGLNPFIVTLASGAVFSGLTLVITKGYPIRPLGPVFKVFGQGDLLAIPIPVLSFLAASGVMIWTLSSTRFGRNIYAIGGNRDAARLVGIPVAGVEMLAYGLAGMFAALAGILYASRMDAGQPAVGEGWLMGAITAAILGGTSLRGGQGTIVGTVFGTLLMATVSNGLSLLNVSGYWERVVIGAIVLLAVLSDLLRRRN